MSIFNLFSFLGGVGLFLFGMHVLGDAIARQAGGKMKVVLEKITSNKLMGIVLGTAVTAIIQSSGATTVMIIGFINSGIISLENAVGPILGANIGTTVTAWLLALNSISGTSFILQLINPDSFVPILAFIGAVMIMFSKRDRTRDFGMILLGFAVLMFGMSAMSDAMSPLRDSPLFKEILTALSNPFLGVLAGFVLAAVLQSSSAAVGIVQALSVTGVVCIGNALPLIMGINVGAGLIVLLAGTGANRDGKRASWIYMLHNCFDATVTLILLCLVKYIAHPDFLNMSVNAFGIAILHTGYKLFNTILQIPFFNQLVELTRRIVKPEEKEEKFNLLDENFLKTPPLAVARCSELTNDMAELTRTTILTAMDVVRNFDDNAARAVRDLESEIDVFEDKIGNYLVKVSASKLSDGDSRTVSRLLHSINDLERMSDHARNIAEAGEELSQKGIEFSDDAREELEVIFAAVRDVTDLAVEAYTKCDAEIAVRIDALEQVVDDLKDELRSNHIRRLKAGACSTTLGFVFTDILTDLERISDHCSNIAMSVLQMNEFVYEPHLYQEALRHNDEKFKMLYKEYLNKYSLKK